MVMVGCENGSVVKCTIDALPAVSATQSKLYQTMERKVPRFLKGEKVLFRRDII